MAIEITVGTDVAMMAIVAPSPVAPPNFSCLGVRKSSIPSSTADAAASNAANENAQE